MIIEISPRALRDISEAYAYIARDNPAAADRLLERLDQLIQQLAVGNLNGPLVRLRAGGQAQRWSIPPFRLYYRRTAELLLVLRVYHQARRPLER